MAEKPVLDLVRGRSERAALVLRFPDDCLVPVFVHIVPADDPMFRGRSLAAGDVRNWSEQPGDVVWDVFAVGLARNVRDAAETWRDAPFLFGDDAMSSALFQVGRAIAYGEMRKAADKVRTLAEKLELLRD